jgi:WD40 repeat protein
MTRIVRGSIGVVLVGLLMESMLLLVVQKVIDVCSLLFVCFVVFHMFFFAIGSLFIWDAKSGALVKQLGSESSATISCVAWNPNGNQVIATDRKSKIVVFE